MKGRERLTFVGHSQGFGHLIQIGDVGLDSIESAFLLQLHLRHFVPGRKVLRVGMVPVVRVLNVGRYVDFTRGTHFGLSFVN